jgi:SAM-dependent methyltransferase
MSSLLTRLIRRAGAPVLRRTDARARHLALTEVDRYERDIVAPLRTQLDHLTAAVTAIEARSGWTGGTIAEHPSIPSTHSVFVPPIERLTAGDDDGFMRYSTCSTADFTHPRLAEICALWNEQPHLHRKLWEHAFIVHHLETAGCLTAGSRGIGFGVGTEPLPAVFASMGAGILATDAPIEHARRDGWVDTNQFAMSAGSLTHDGICAPETFLERVEYRTVDMNRIPDDITDFDFCWSSCCFEHLGSLRHGIDFVIDSVERTLRPGGVAVHTTEFNLSSDDDTVETPTLSIYRRRDIETLIASLEARGHTVDPLAVAPHAHVLDYFVDTPPYHHGLHLKLALEGYVTTSVGLVIRRGGT